MADVNLNENGLLVELLSRESSGNLDDDLARFTKAPIRVTHKPTGLSAIGEHQGNQVKNKEKALEILKVLLAIQG